MEYIFVNLAVPVFLRIFFRRRGIPFYAQVIGCIEDLFVVLELLLFPLTPILGLFVQLFLILDAFLYHKMQLRMRLHYCSHFRHIKTMVHSAQELGLHKFLAVAFLVVAGNVFVFFGAPSDISWMSVVGVGALAGIGRMFLSKTEIYAAGNMFFQEQVGLFSFSKPKTSPLPRESFSGPRRFEIKIDPGEKPHVVLVFLESFGAKAVREKTTPHFNRLAKEGVLFSNFYSNGTLTYRALISGLFGVMPGSTASGLAPYVGAPFEGLPEVLKKAGYKTAFHHNGSLSYDRQWEFLQPHFDEIIDRNALEDYTPGWGAPDESLMRYTAEWLAKQNSPAFVTLFTISNHHPWIVPNGYVAPSFGFPRQSPQERFLQTMHYTDHSLHLLVELFKEKNLSKKTILIFVGDHGQPMGEHQGNFYNSRFLYEENVRVPLLILAEGRIDTPCVIEDLGSHADLFPTVVDLLQLDGYGASLMRKMTERTVMLQNPYSEGFWGCREGNWKWIENRLSSEGELYDLSKDPEERKNVAEENLELANIFREKTRNYFTAIDSPIAETVPSQLELDFSSMMILDQELIESVKPSLQRLNLQDCLLLTDVGIGFVLANCPNLEMLNLKGVTDLTDRAFEKENKLLQLDISDAHQLTDQGVVQLMKSSPHLSILYLNCRNLTDLGMVGHRLTRLQLFEAHHLSTFAALLENNRHLNRLTIDGCTHLTDQTLSLLKQHPLEHLALFDAPQITDEGIGYLTELPLRSLHLKNCQGISKESLQIFDIPVIYQD